MNAFKTFWDGSSMSGEDWEGEILVREEIFVSGMASLFGLKELKLPLSVEAQKYETRMGWKRKEFSANAESLL